jgi:transposase
MARCIEQCITFVLKRQMFGRAGFQLLRKRVLLAG